MMVVWLCVRTREHQRPESTHGVGAGPAEKKKVRQDNNNSKKTKR
jgi:hypothetical protein